MVLVADQLIEPGITNALRYGPLGAVAVIGVVLIYLFKSPNHHINWPTTVIAAAGLVGMITVAIIAFFAPQRAPQPLPVNPNTKAHAALEAICDLDVGKLQQHLSLSLEPLAEQIRLAVERGGVSCPARKK